MTITKLKKYLKPGYVLKITISRDPFISSHISSFNIDIRKPRQTHNIFYNTVNIESSKISCGIKQMSGLVRSWSIDDLIPMLKNESNVKNFLKDMYNYYASEVKFNNNAAYVLVSNNNDLPIVNKALDEICTYKTKWTLNPNSNNKIKVWTI